jgi:hypothetical protein
MTFPKQIFVRVETDGDGDKFLLAHSKLFDAAEDDQRTVGVYKLVGTKKVCKVVQVRS